MEIFTLTLYGVLSSGTYLYNYIQFPQTGGENDSQYQVDTSGPKYETLGHCDTVTP